MNDVAKRVLTVFVSLFLLAYVGYQAYLALYHPLRTQRAEISTVRDFISADAFVLRSEIPICADTGGGVIAYTRSDGESVPVGGTVAKIYASAADADTESSLKAVEDRIAQLQADGTSENVAAVDTGALDGEIDDVFLRIADETSGGNAGDISEDGESLLDLFNKKQLATGEVKDFNAAIAALQSQKTALSQKSAGPKSVVAASVSGSFVSRVDGYEDAYDISKILTISPDTIKKLMTAKPSVKSGAVGKIITRYQWYITCVVKAADAHRLKVGSSLSVQFPLSSESEVPVTVAAVNQSGDRYAVVLECDTMTGGLSAMRKQSVQIVLKDVKGIRLDDSVIHIANGKKGVYVLTGNAVRFRTIDPVYSGNGYTISAIDTSDPSQLQAYDSVIVNGDDLFDGKVIK